MLTYLQAIILGALQGITELFPISSLGHSVILPSLLGWDIKQDDPFFLVFLVATHAATALVLLLFFWNDWKRIILGIFRSLKEREINENDTDAKLGWLLVIGTIPAGLLGLLFEDSLKALFANPQLVAGVLILNGLLLLATEKLSKRHGAVTEKNSNRRIAKLSWAQAIKVGCMQCLALIPGFSRTGAAMTGSLLNGLTYEDAARFSFLLATPIITAAAVLKLPELLTETGVSHLGPTLIGSVSSAIFAYLSVKFLTKYFETKKLWPFGVYCVVAGVMISLFFIVRS
jgi:undecaprenyl-diphosphatase